jgi:hypothetical protein
VRKVVVRLCLGVAGLIAIPLGIYVKAYLDAELPPPLNGPIFSHISTSENVPWLDCHGFGWNCARISSPGGRDACAHG